VRVAAGSTSKAAMPSLPDTPAVTPAPRAVGDRPVFPIGMGCMPLSASGGPEPAAAVRTIHAALDAGVTLLDTADAYCPGAGEEGHNERLIARALRGRARDGIVVATKGGHTRPRGSWDLDGRPEHLRAACEASLRALETDRIDLYQLHRPDPDVAFAESVGALRELRDAGKVRMVGLSNVTVAQLDEAEAIVPIASVQNELSPRYTDPLRNGELAACAERGVAFLPWAPFGGAGAAPGVAAEVDAVGEVAARHGVSRQRVILAWLLSLAGAVVPIPGASRPETILDSIGAATLALGAGEVAALQRALGGVEAGAAA
jgi:aryl-alcohol dehydrogenase-like predicted oxidoreductase